MPARVLPTFIRAALLGALLVAVQACASAQTATEVAQAYETSGVISLQHPYTRTIFSGTQF